MPAASAPQPDPSLCAALAADLEASEFRSEPLRQLWGEEADDALARGMRQPILRAIDGDSGPLATLGRLFVLGMPQPLDAVAAALPSLGTAGLQQLGLATLEDGQAVPQVLLRPQSFVDSDGVGEWWIASDLDEVALGSALPADHVLGVGGASRTLAELIIPVPVARALDLGCGCGIQALLISRHADEVVATDISQRALDFARLNALLNGVTNIVFRHGSLFEPVAGETFDLIVSNPPFVITPRSEGVPEYEYRDGGLVGDALVEQFIRTAPEHLAPGGVAQLLGNWESVEPVAEPGRPPVAEPVEASGTEPVAEPVEASGPSTRSGRPPVAEPVEASGLERVESWVPDALDVWVIEREELSPLSYAELWIRDGGTTPRDAVFDELLAAWLDDFAARGVTAIGFGYVLLRRPAAPTMSPRLRRFERVPQAFSSPGRALYDGLRAHDTLADGIPATLVCAPDVTEARHLLPGSDDPTVIELRQGGGLGRTVSVDPALAALVGACDGELTVGQIVAALAQLFEVPLPELWHDLEPRVRSLVIDGFLLPAPSPGIAPRQADPGE